MTDEILVSMFPDDNAIPDQYRIGVPMEQRRYLCDGEIKEWRGSQQDVLSPICMVAGGAVGQKRIGSYPLLTEVQALEVLDAARGAYDHDPDPRTHHGQYPDFQAPQTGGSSPRTPS